MERRTHKTVLIGEVAQAQEVSLGSAHAFIDMAKECGIDAVKFQTHIAEFESSRLEPWRVKFSFQDADRYDYWKRMEFTEEQWKGLVEHALESGLEFIGTPFSIEGFDLLWRNGVKSFKVASGEISNVFLLKEIAKKAEKIYISSGMSTWSELDKTMTIFRDRQSDIVLMQCTTMYPNPPEFWGLNIISEMKQRYSIPIGYSDHSGTIYSGLAASTLGIDALEVHMCMNKMDFGPDTSSSLTMEEIKRLVTGVREIDIAISNIRDKDEVSKQLVGVYSVFSKSLALKPDMKSGTQIDYSDLLLLKPMIEIPANQIDNVVGNILKNDKKKGEFLKYSDI